LTYVNELARPTAEHPAQVGCSPKGAAVVTITYLEHDGTARNVDASVGLSVMDNALAFKVPGIEGDCGGFCACGTCHVYVEGGWFERLPPMSELERDMVTLAHDPQPNSRLSCQIRVDDGLDGLVVRTPPRQY
jgi:2Fe-2S ferredoxin